MNENNNTESVLYAVGTRGYSAYEVAVQNGFVGTEQEWLDSLVGPQGPQGQPFDELTPEQKAEITGPEGKSAYEVAVEEGFEGTEEDFVNSYLNADNYYNKSEIDDKEDTLIDIIDDYKNTINQSVTDQNSRITNINGMVNSLSDEIDSVVSGSPSGVYDTVSDLETDNPDQTKIYLVLDDGKWYYYDTGDAAWTAGGVYQTSGISKTTIDKINKKTYLKEIKLNPNELFTQTNSANYGNISYNTKCWRNGYMANDHGTSDTSCFYGRTRYRLDNFFGNIPRALKVKILDTSALNQILIRVGYTDTSNNIVLANETQETELFVELPTYPDRDISVDGQLMISVGRFSSNITASAENIAAIEARYGQWFDENVEVYWYFDELLPNRDYSIRSSNTLPSFNNSFIYNSEYQFALKLPDNYHPYTQEKTPLIILCHGLSSTISQSSWGSSDMIALVNNFISKGYAVMDVNRVTTADWCNPALIKKYSDAIDYIIKHYNVEPKYVYGESMGCLIGLTLQEQYNIKAMVISGLRLDFETRYNEYDDSGKAIIDANLGFTDGFDKYIANGWCKTITSVKDQDNNDVNPHTFPPTLYMAGNGDTQNNESILKIQAIRRGGNIADLKEYVGDHHALCYLLAGTSMQDCLDWFDKWK